MSEFDNDSAPPLSLSSPGWASLQTRNGDGRWIAEWIAQLQEDPHSIEMFTERWPELCSEETTWPAGLAAFPYLVGVTAQRAQGSRLEHIAVLGMIASCWQPSPSFHVPENVDSAYQAAIPRALRLAAEEAAQPLGDERELRYVLSAIAALQGQKELAQCIDTLDDEETSPRYADSVWG